MLIDNKLSQKESSIIKIIGVGGGGGNAVNYMFQQGIKDVDFVICNTDLQALNNSKIATKIQLGVSLTEGRGAGSKPGVGRESAIENLDDVIDVLEDNTKMVFITAGMGGGTGTGATPIIAKTAKDMGILTVVIVTIPFAFEGPKRIEQAWEGINKLKENVDSLLVINNEKLCEIHGKLSFSEAFAKADDVLTVAAKGIAEIITLHGYVNVDFEDVKTVMTDSGIAVMGAATAEGEDRALTAIRNALASPLLDNNSVAGASKILLNITSGTDEFTLDEMGVITDYVNDAVGSGGALIWGTGSDEALGSKVSVTVIATGFAQNKDVEPPQKPKEEVKVGDKIPLDVNQPKKEEIVCLTNLTNDEMDELDKEPAYIRRKIKLSRYFN